MARWKQFCFSPDETIHAEGGEDDVEHRPTAPDKVGVRQSETRRAGPVWPNSGGFRLARTPGATFADPLDLEPNRRGRMVPSSHEAL
ncbi:hypothetical protein [uncultured Hoeflea sp.]|uniref:hypothetical protein n=1 Tax=uncultured Hoeflea sp. TaxID=538666 RepID=UPI0030DAF6FF